MDFTSRLMLWYEQHQRDLPWRHSSDAYKIWLSEIILQQTRIAQGLSYYQRFTDHFPNVNALAAASEDQVLALWQGLGYYSRARNLHQTAKTIVEQYGGGFPASYKELGKLKGIGPYTAAAIASMAFNLPHAAVDGNVVRVLSRYLGIEEPVDESATFNDISNAAQQLLDPAQPGAFNQALMDLGAMICKPAKPLCQQCPFFNDCRARIASKVELIPLKKKKVKVKTRFFHFFFVFKRRENDMSFVVQKRDTGDIWRNLHQIPLVETPNEQLTEKDTEKNQVLQNLFKSRKKNTLPNVMYRTTHQLTHQRIEAFFYVFELSPEYLSDFDKSLQWLTFDQFRQLGKPVLISRFLDRIEQKPEQIR